MKNEKDIRKRLAKRYHSLARSNDNVLQTLQTIFINFDLETFRTELTLWQTLALANGHSAYDDANSREDLMDFMSAFLKLVEAFWIINQRRIDIQNNSMPEVVDTTIHSLNAKELANPSR